MTDSSLLNRYAARAAFGLLLLAFVIPPLLAQDAQEISRLIRLGQYAAAAEKVNAVLARMPKDPQARFLKGVLLSEQGKADDAIATFQSLSEDYPELPEPYNNLASLYATKGQYEKAKTALEMAIQINPSYATAYENLGDVYAKMASQAYDKVLQLDRANTTAPAKLASIRSALTASGKPPAPAAPAAPKKSEAPAPAAAAATALPANAAAVLPANAVAPAAAVIPPVTPVAVRNEAAAIVAAVEAWASAWATRNLESYLGAYSKNFVPERKTRVEWEAARRSSFPAARAVQVRVDQPQITMLGADQAQVTFHQHYRSERVKLNTRKELVLMREDGAWHIAKERIVP